MSQKDLHKALGPLAPLFEDPDVMVVMVDGPERVTVEKHGKVEDTAVRFRIAWPAALVRAGDSAFAGRGCAPAAAQ